MKTFSGASLLLYLFAFFASQSYIIRGVAGKCEDSDEGESSSSEEDEGYYVEDSNKYSHGGKLNKNLPGVNSQNCVCGRSKSLTKIVGGENSGTHEWPWMVAITNVTEIDLFHAYLKVKKRTQVAGRGFTLFCGGSLINNRYILTAAHCAVIMQAVGLEKFRVILGDNQINGSSLYRKVFSVITARVHPKYEGVGSITYDAALLQLDSFVTFNSAIVPVCLGQRGSPFTGLHAKVAGWGSTAPTEYIATNNLMDTSVRVISNSYCNVTYAGANDSPNGVSPSMMCAYSPGSDSCFGDSGGPLFLVKSSFPQLYTQVGIVSYGENCAGKYPGVYTRVQKILKWIIYATKGSTYCRNSFTE